MYNRSKLIREVVLIATSAAILFTQQVVFSMLPNIQLTTLLIVLYSKVLGFKRTSLIVLIHVTVYNFLSPFGAVLPTHFPFMIIAWMIIPISLNTFLKGVNSSLGLALFGLGFGFVYGWVLIPPAVFIMNVPFWTYLMMDIPFEIIMAVTNFITIYWLYDRLEVMLSNLTNNFLSDTVNTN